MGEGGAIILNNNEDYELAEIIREKGTNRSKFYRGQIDKYTWVDYGSSYLPSDMNAAYLYAQIENKDLIQKNRINIWNKYFETFKDLEKKGKIRLPIIPKSNNAHINANGINGLNMLSNT